MADVFPPASGGHDDEFTGVVAVHGPDELREMHAGQGLAGVMDDFSLYDFGGHGAWVPGRVWYAACRCPHGEAGCRVRVSFVDTGRTACMIRIRKVYLSACRLVNSACTFVGCLCRDLLRAGFFRPFPPFSGLRFPVGSFVRRSAWCEDMGVGVLRDDGLPGMAHVGCQRIKKDLMK